MSELKQYEKESRDNWIGGLIMIAVGTLVLASRAIDFGNFGLFIPLMLGVVFTLLGISQRQLGFLIPGGILSGIGTGILAMEGVSGLSLGIDDGAIFMLCFAGGWGMIALLSAMFTDEEAWWALIPGGIMALIGAAIGFGGMFESTLSLVGQGWPLVLVAIGVWTLLRAGRHA